MILNVRFFLFARIVGRDQNRWAMGAAEEAGFMAIIAHWLRQYIVLGRALEMLEKLEDNNELINKFLYHIDYYEDIHNPTITLCVSFKSIYRDFHVPHRRNH